MLSATSVGLSYASQNTTVNARFGLGIDGTTLRATLLGADNPNFILTPSGNVAEQIVSGVAWPLAQTMASVFSALAGTIFSGTTFPVFTVGPMGTTVQGETVTITPRSLVLSANQDMALVQGDLDVS